MSVFALDVDGTLDSSNGPIPTQRMVELRERGHTVVVVSESGAFPKTPEGESVFVRVVGKPRVNNLQDVMAAYPGQDLYLYISDNPADDQIAAAAGFSYMHPSHFR